MFGETFDKIRVFQSTLPVGGATSTAGQDSFAMVISIHAPRGGSDPCIRGLNTEQRKFQSTLPVGGATGSLYICLRELRISIHAPRGGSDAPNNTA